MSTSPSPFNDDEELQEMVNHKTPIYSTAAAKTNRKSFYIVLVILLLFIAIVLVEHAILIITYVTGTIPPFKAPAAKPKNIILMIADGFGPASQTFARLLNNRRPLPLDSYFCGTSRTPSVDKNITESPAGATAISCGYKTENLMIGTLPGNVPCATVLEAAMTKGKSVGLIATKSLTDATPASFGAHVSSRYMENEIAEHLIVKVPGIFAKDKPWGFDVLLGGGRSHFIPKSSPGSRREDDKDLTLIAKEKGYHYATTRGELAKAAEAKRLPLLGLFASKHLKFVIDRNPEDQEQEPTLIEMAKTALDVLERTDNPNGFFLVIEGSKVDSAAHEQDLAAHYREIMAYQETAQYVFDWAKKDGNTLVVSTADHETGGITLGRYVSTDVMHLDGILDRKKSFNVLSQLLKAATNDAEMKQIILDAGFYGLTDEEFQVVKTSPKTVPGIDCDYCIGLGRVLSERTRTSITTDWHTAVDVNIYSYGPQREMFIGNMENTEIGVKIAKLLSADLDSLSSKLKDELK